MQPCCSPGLLFSRLDYYFQIRKGLGLWFCCKTLYLLNAHMGPGVLYLQPHASLSPSPDIMWKVSFSPLLNFLSSLQPLPTSYPPDQYDVICRRRPTKGLICIACGIQSNLFFPPFGYCLPNVVSIEEPSH